MRRYKLYHRERSHVHCNSSHVLECTSDDCFIEIEPHAITIEVLKSYAHQYGGVKSFVDYFLGLKMGSSRLPAGQIGLKTFLNENPYGNHIFTGPGKVFIDCDYTSDTMYIRIEYDHMMVRVPSDKGEDKG